MNVSLGAVLSGNRVGLPTSQLCTTTSQAARAMGQQVVAHVWQEPGTTQRSAFALGCIQPSTLVQSPGTLWDTVSLMGFKRPTSVWLWLKSSTWQVGIYINFTGDQIHSNHLCAGSGKGPKCIPNWSIRNLWHKMWTRVQQICNPDLGAYVFTVEVGIHVWGICLNAQGEHLILKSVHGLTIQCTAYIGKGCVF